MLAEFWFTFLYQPLLNALVWIYSNIADLNLGWAVVWLTVFLRFVLLPLTIKSIKDEQSRGKIEEDAKDKAKTFKGDLVAQKEAIRTAMRKNKVSPWAKFIALAIQGLILVLLYQVFIGGIEGRKIVRSLYDFVDYPGMLNTNFYGFNIGANHDYIWAGIVAIYLVTMILWGNRNKKWDSGKLAFLILFPLSTFWILWFLPMVKSLFILTSLVFSDIIVRMIQVFMTPKEKREEEKQKKQEEKEKEKKEKEKSEK